MSAEQRELLDRIRPLVTHGEVREVTMFGAIALMVDDAMLIAANRDGSLLVRVSPSEDPELVREPDAARAEMGTGREMGTGWLRVDLGVSPDPQRLRHWVDAALRRHAQHPRSLVRRD